MTRVRHTVFCSDDQGSIAPPRGTNENTNGLLRQYLPKSTDLNLTNTTRLEEIVTELNNRPRRALKWQTPHEVFNAAVLALTA